VEPKSGKRSYGRSLVFGPAVKIDGLSVSGSLSISTIESDLCDCECSGGFRVVYGICTVFSIGGDGVRRLHEMLEACFDIHLEPGATHDVNTERLFGCIYKGLHRNLHTSGLLVYLE